MSVRYYPPTWEGFLTCGEGDRRWEKFRNP